MGSLAWQVDALLSEFARQESLAWTDFCACWREVDFAQVHHLAEACVASNRTRLQTQFTARAIARALFSTFLRALQVPAPLEKRVGALFGLILAASTQTVDPPEPIALAPHALRACVRAALEARGCGNDDACVALRALTDGDLAVFEVSLASEEETQLLRRCQGQETPSSEDVDVRASLTSPQSFVEACLETGPVDLANDLRMQTLRSERPDLFCLLYNRDERTRTFLARWYASSNDAPDPLTKRDHIETVAICDAGIRVVAFDMDQTAVGAHSRGRLRRGAPLAEFLSKTKADFIALVPELLERGLGVAIATHSDASQFRYNNVIRPSTHILGLELAQTVIRHAFSAEIAEAFKIIAYNPRAHDEGTEDAFLIKRYHMRVLQEHYSVAAQEILFFDDARVVVDDCNETCGVRAFAVDPLRGFELADAQRALDVIEAKLLEPSTSADEAIDP
ncbi:snRNA-activating protein complex subunit 1 [Hondaea fermentalgiana]|uniref:snRNA-activating protein complex subunit 1 n=1 Tax=Hondaea fermentalgiana TaxID=2315210 RepID=A0A2R5GEV2_9STRA|nr:snRNA-activating protein complex subunit 1 [Hondaea fermentalgiana]|eukprot:GBG29472.1 snRNA-activating protein complex subunit 1 [Hondaea fermentalgiana]